MAAMRIDEGCRSWVTRPRSELRDMAFGRDVALLRPACLASPEPTPEPAQKGLRQGRPPTRPGAR